MAKEIRWSLDQTHSEVGFKVRHLMISNVKGKFETFDANIYTTDKDFSTAEIDFWIDATSINTGNEKRDEHLKSRDFLDVKNHKQITFNSSTIGAPDENGNHELWGELMIKGVSKNVKFIVQFGGTINDPWGKERAGFTVTGIIKRSDWDVVWNASLDSGGFMLGDELTISCDIELINEGEKGLKLELEPSASKLVSSK
jgi:polyisoprenoid-binding protein YceI